MPLLEDNPSQDGCPITKRFERALMQILAANESYQKQILALTEENKALKSLLKSYRENPNLGISIEKSSFVAPASGLIDEINKYIKEIDSCLAYFEQA